MSWQGFRWSWRLDAPLFVGTTPAGALNRCRLYVPGKAVWGALTAELTRHERGDSAATAQDYKDVGSQLKRDYRFTYLYPAELSGTSWLAWIPKYQEGNGLVWIREDDRGPVSDRRFRRRLLWTRPGTAIDPTTDAVVDGSLRETECLQPYWRNEIGHESGPVALVGYVFIRRPQGSAGNAIDRLAPIRSLLIGGDIRYGLGRLEMERGSMEPATTLFGAALEFDDDKPLVITDHLLAHAVCSNDGLMHGDLEVLGGWDMTERQLDRRMTGQVWTPGSVATRCVHWSVDDISAWAFKE